MLQTHLIHIPCTQEYSLHNQIASSSLVHGVRCNLSQRKTFLVILSSGILIRRFHRRTISHFCGIGPGTHPISP
uniref:Uncharacterized protein n=1 Tax=Anguilla anguilla TaxID=7936 RepID=A0A0E9XE26_ANGAN